MGGGKAKVFLQVLLGSPAFAGDRRGSNKSQADEKSQPDRGTRKLRRGELTLASREERAEEGQGAGRRRLLERQN